MKKFLLLTSVFLAFSFLTVTCGPTPTPEVIEKVVKETVVVEKEVEVIKVVEKEVEVEVTKVVEKEVVVTATPRPPASVVQEATYALKGDPVTMFPVLLSNAAAEGFLELLYEPLVTVDEKTNEIIPWLAESWEWIGDTTVQFKLRQGIKHASGNEFTAEDVKWTLEANLDPEIGSYHRIVLAEIESVEVVDKYTVNVHTSAPSRALLRNLTYVADIVDSKWAEEHGLEYLVTHASGTGPYRLLEYMPGQYAVVEKRDDYWNDDVEVFLDKITLRIVPEDGARVAALLAGEFQAIEKVPVEMVSLIENSPGTQMISVPSVRPIFMAFRVTKPPFDDPKMRQAVMYALDFDLINESVYMGFGGVEATVNHPEVACTLTTLKPWPYDPEKAREILAEAGYAEGAGPEIVMIGPNGRYLKDKEFAEAVAAQLEEVGFQVDLRLFEVGVWFRQVGSRPEETDDHLFVASWANNPREPHFTYGPNWGYTEGTSLYETAYRNDRAIELVKLGRETLDMEKACEHYAELQEILYEDMPWGAKFIYLPAMIATTDTIEGVQVRANETWSLITARIVE